VPRPHSFRALAVAVAILAVAVSGATASDASKARVVISEHGAVYPAGTFVLKGAAGSDIGTNDVRTFEGPLRVLDGQYLYTAHGTDTLRGKKGSIKLSWVGTHVDAGGVFIEYGTWHILPGTGTGMYKGWSGGGRYAATLKAQASAFSFTIQREGLVTR
jgi:hypothetical protein